MVGVAIATFPININNINRRSEYSNGASENFQIYMTLEPDYKNFKY